MVNNMLVEIKDISTCIEKNALYFTTTKVNIFTNILVESIYLQIYPYVLLKKVFNFSAGKTVKR